MDPRPLTVPLSATFSQAFQLMVEHRADSLPVVDEAGVYRGMFDLADVWRVLLPKAAQLGMDSLKDLAFTAASEAEMRDRLKIAGQRPVGEMLGRDVPEVFEDTSAQELVLLLYRHGSAIPVIERKTRRLLGIVNPWLILDDLRS